MRRVANLLFSGGQLSDVLHHQKNEAAKYVSSLPQAQVLASTDDQVMAHALDKFGIEPIALHLDQQQKSMQESTYETHDRFTYDLREGESLRVSGVAFIVVVPFSGDAELFKFQPSMWSSKAAAADILKPDEGRLGKLTFSFNFNQHGVTPEVVSREIESTISYVADIVQRQRSQIDQFQGELRQIISTAVADRRSKLSGLQALAKALDIPIAVRPGMPSLTPIQVARKVAVELPPVANANQPSGFSITDDAFENILAAIRAQGRTFEKTPRTFSKFDEEELRDILLGNLNTHFRGQATGETFRAKGKTDISIEQDNRAAFVGECKLWYGPKELLAGLKQLLGYLTWRDCKTALVVFNKDRGRFSEILEKAPAILRDQKELFHSEVRQVEPGEWRMRFKAPDDDNRVVTVQLMVYNLYTK